MNIIETLEKYEPQSLQHELPIVWDFAYGYHVWDTEGKRYIDFTSGIFVANIGHSHPKVLQAILGQINEPLIHSYVFPNEPRAKLVKKLAEISGMEKVYLCSTGSEAVEAALRCIWSYKPGGLLAVKGCNHGRTAGVKILAEEAQLTYKMKPNRGIKPENIAGIIFETYLGYNAQFHPVKWVREWCGWAQKNDIPVCFDEIQAGFGRTGKMFGFEHYDVKPDLICVGKGLGGGMPISAVLGRADLLDAPDDLSSTHTGNPVCCAAALATLEVLEEEGLVDRASSLGELLGDLLPKMFPEYTIRGKGMVWGIDLEDIDLANKVVDKCAGKGLLLVKTHKGTIKIGAPLVIPEKELAEGLQILREAVKECV